MKKLVLAVGVALVWTAATVVTQAPPQTRADRPPVSQQQIEEWMTSLSNWGKWGADDQLGALNYVTPAKRQQAAALVTAGVVVSLERPVVLRERHDDIKKDGKPNTIPFYELTFRTFPPGWPLGSAGFSSDVHSFAPHGALMTHLDALCHNSDGKGRLYNGYSLAETVREDAGGCTRLGLDTLHEGIVTRGILVDMTRLRAARVGTRVYVEDIEAWERQTGLKVSSGDALFVYNPQPATGPNAAPGAVTNVGFDTSTMPWMRERGVALTSGADHRLTLVAMGIFLLDSPNLAPLAETAARLGRWEFMLMLAPPLVPGGTGYPVNPLALF